ncbi:MAG: class I poly(R)-hydroxyalkanoic acid synthase [Pseudorhodoplanes sp.]
MRDKTPDQPTTIGSVDVEKFAHNLARMVEEGGKALAAYLKPREEGRIKDDLPREIGEIVSTLAAVSNYWLADPQRAVALQTRLAKGYLDLWGAAAKRLAGEDAAPVVAPDAKDKRFADPEWSSNQFFDFLKQAYLLGAQWADGFVRDAEGIDPHTRQKAEFYVRQITNALSPSNYVLTNPELLRETMNSHAENLARGMQMLAEDIDADGNLVIRQSDSEKFEVGRNLATTPGKVVFQNELMQLIQYEPATEKVLRIPVLIVPPWINKFYVLDLTPEKSFIRWCVEQGLTVFVVSWANPDASLADKTFEDYMRLGPLAALDAVRQITGEQNAHAVGYCVGGTLLAVTLAYLAGQRGAPVKSATFFATQVDFTEAGDLKVFVDEPQLAALEKSMKARGYLEGRKMADTFNLLRSNDLIWPYVVNNYLKGKAPFPFDLLYWNADATRIPAANHSFYLRACYLDNRLARGEMEIDGTKLDLKKVTMPIYNLATREDHIAPALSVFRGASAFGGPMRLVVAGSGHIAGVVNPVSKGKYQYWTNDAPLGDTFETWLDKAVEHPGSWWPDWLQWLKIQDDEQVPARKPGSDRFKPLEDAPGSYVKVRS